MVRSFLSWLSGGCFGPRDARASLEAAWLRVLGVAYLVAFIVITLDIGPLPTGGGGRGAILLFAVVVFAAAAITLVATMDGEARRSRPSHARAIALLAVVGGATAVVEAIQPYGMWQAAPGFIGIIAAIQLERRASALTLGCALATFIGVGALVGSSGTADGVCVGALVLFLGARLMREMRDRHGALEARTAAEVHAAALAERSRLAREMHDVLAHSLSALALQLESTRLLAHDRGADPAVTRAIDQAHHIAAGGLEEARQAIAAARGEELPGPDRLGALVDVFVEQSGLPVTLEVLGEPRELAPDARLAVYRTAQEALTNVRRHAAAQRVRMRLDYQEDSTVLVVEDDEPADAPPSVALSDSGAGFGLTGMRERAELLGGRLLAQPTAHGFRVELQIPATPERAMARG